MSSSSKRSSLVAYVQNAAGEDDLEGIVNTHKYAMSDAQDRPAPNTGRSRADKRPSSARSSSSGTGLTDSDSTARSSESKPTAGKQPRRPNQHNRRRDRPEPQRPRAGSAAPADRDPRTPRKARPPAARHATQPVVQQAGYVRARVEDPACYGVKQAAAPARPRPARYHPQPPMMGPGWHPPPPPPPSSMWPENPAVFAPPPSPVGPPGYFDTALAAPPHSRLRHRFESRPSSAMGFHAPALEYRPDECDESTPHVSRRPSTRDEDARRMLPPSFVPQRPQSALPPTTAFRPPPRRFVNYDEPRYDDDYDEASLDDSLFHDISPNASFEQRAVVARPRRGSVYGQPGYDMVPATGRGRRGPRYGVSFADKLDAAVKYQEEVSGAQVPLTAETLRKVRRGVPSSRSTRSSGSRDESEYKRSNTTGTTQSSYGHEEITIKVPGNAIVRLQGAEIACNEGGEITYTSRPSAGSNRATVYQLDGRERSQERKALAHRPRAHRQRAASRADSQSHYYAPYEGNIV